MTPSGYDSVQPAPDILGDAYDVIRELGRGGMAAVYLARERATGVERAVKVIHHQFVGDPEAVARFRREAQLVAQLTHPGIVPIHAVESLHGMRLALVMDRIPGRTVREIMRDDGAMPCEQVERILTDVADALGHAHAQGVIHRDVKPENIFVDETTGHALLSDFGIARSLDTDTDTQLTNAGVTIGTPTYMAPEQIDGDVLDGRCDLYSLGVVGWEMLTGQRPWAGESLYSVLYHQKCDALPSIDTIRPETPARLRTAIEGLLEKSPGDRWSSAADFRAQLTATTPVVRRARVPHAIDSVSSMDTVIIPRPSRARSRWAMLHKRTLWVGIPIAAVVLLLAVNVLGTRPQFVSHPRSYPRSYPTAIVASARAHPPVQVAAVVDTAVLSTERVDTEAVPSEESLPYPSATSPPTITATVPPPPPIAVAAVTSVHTLPPSVMPELIRKSTYESTEPARKFWVVTGVSHTCLVSPDGKLFCWGSDDRGQLGIGTTQRRVTKTRVGTDSRFSVVTLGLSHTCALTTEDSAYCWGGNEHGQLGDGTTSERSKPTRVSGRVVFRMVTAGLNHSCALALKGAVSCWGSGGHGQLGTGEKSDHTAPVAVVANVKFSTVVAGWNHTCALGDDGRAYCWGDNDTGALGDGTTTDRLVPTPVRTNVRFVSLSAGSAHTCGITTLGRTYCWGQNTYGELGDGTTISRLAPTLVEGEMLFVAVSAGGVHSCALTREHEAWCWGRNTYGQLGDGSTTNRTRPGRVVGSHPFVTLNAFGAHSCGTTTTDELFCWGYNLDGQLGDGTREHRSRPTYVEKPAI